MNCEILLHANIYMKNISVIPFSIWNYFYFYKLTKLRFYYILIVHSKKKMSGVIYWSVVQCIIILKQSFSHFTNVLLGRKNLSCSDCLKFLHASVFNTHVYKILHISLSASNNCTLLKSTIIISCSSWVARIGMIVVVVKLYLNILLGKRYINLWLAYLLLRR